MRTLQFLPWARAAFFRQQEPQGFSRIQIRQALSAFNAKGKKARPGRCQTEVFTDDGR
ncbi:hypothetical protein HMPREF1986_02805 [Oribacterium sp. oral taxon 078 str. F0263]|nr:hypothetical protein HMPREF1986_02805 [Oribacterium sp. oral taxon 078 str. F0263]